ncbi:MAG: hypothetical protein KKC68_06070 [Candidatus Thermoplasmatota archaeon]|nr:hypothetical protein [Candidatus Thermoplasmatota archaeon]MBU1941323.1 hypothetical protein [Candidatus Thermoplasmatota archaeon]
MRHILSIILNILIILSPLSTAWIVPTEDTNNNSLRHTIPDWYDGHFAGQLINILTSEKSNIQGTITLGRTNVRGIFTAYYTDSNNSEFIEGIFTQRFLFGSIHKDSTKSPFFGKLTIEPCSISATIWAPLKGIFQLYSHYDASFLYPLTGPFNIGVNEHHLIDLSRPENFTADPDDYREMMLRLWYPVEKKNFSYGLADYMDTITFQWLKGRSPIPLITIPNTAYKYIQLHGRTNPPIDKTHGPYPVIIFSHGYDGVYQIYSSLIEDLVSNGYIVASINHPFIAGVTVFPDNRTITVSSIPSDPEEQAAWLEMGRRAIIEDAKFVLDFLTDLNNTNPEVLGTFDLSHVGMYGHSFGGGGTAICCYEDSRFTAGLTLDGFFSANEISGGLSTPFLMMVTGDRFMNDTSLNLIWANLTNEAFLVGITGAQHYSFTDVGILLDHLLPLAPSRLLGFGTIDQKRMINITISVERAFFDVFLKNASPDILTTVLNTFSEINYIEK